VIKECAWGIIFSEQQQSNRIIAVFVEPRGFRGRLKRLGTSSMKNGWANKEQGGGGGVLLNELSVVTKAPREEEQKASVWGRK